MEWIFITLLWGGQPINGLPAFQYWSTCSDLAFIGNFPTKDKDLKALTGFHKVTDDFACSTPPYLWISNPTLSWMSNPILCYIRMYPARPSLANQTTLSPIARYYCRTLHCQKNSCTLAFLGKVTCNNFSPTSTLSLTYTYIIFPSVSLCPFPHMRHNCPALLALTMIQSWWCHCFPKYSCIYCIF